MDRLAAFVAITHLRLRLDILTRYPHLLEPDMEIRRPIELAGLKSRLVRAKKQQEGIADTGKRFDIVMDQIDEAHGAAKAHAGDLEQYAGELKRTIESMVAGSNEAEGTDSADPPTEPEPVLNALGGPRILRST